MRRTHRQIDQDNRAVVLSLVLIALSLFGIFGICAATLVQGNVHTAKMWEMFVVVDMVLVAILAGYVIAINRS